LVTDANYTCAHCQAQFVEKYSFDIHLKYSQACHDANPQVFKCGKCGEVFTTLINLQQHIRRHEQNNHPTSTYSSSQEVSNSSTSQTPIPAGDREHFQCEFCDKSFAQNEDLQEHLQTHSKGHPSDGSCYMEQNGQESNLAEYKSHQFLDKDKSEPLKCHFSVHKRQHQCQYCSKSFSGRGKLNRHVKIHTGEKLHQCEFCSKSFYEKSHLKHHLMIHTGQRPHHCQHCGKSFRDKCNLKRHLVTHTGEKHHQCPHCSKSFRDKHYLQHHLMIHTKEKPYQCPQCSKSFRLRVSLKHHLLNHTGKKPYCCKYCGKGFVQSLHLQCHVRTHTGEKPYLCKHCGKAFTDPSNLRRHEKTHSGKKPYLCEHCGRAFTCRFK